MARAPAGALLLSLWLGSPAGAAEGRSLALLTPGTFHGDEVEARSGEPWLALVPEGGSFELRACRIVVKVVNNPIVDEEGQATGKEVSGCGEAVVILSTGGTPPLQPGRVASVPAPDADLLVGGEVLLAGGSFRPVRLSLPREGDGCRVVAERAGIRQVLDAAYLCGETVEEEGTRTWQPNESKPRILWAGDLDRDGSLDVIAQLSDHYNVSRVCLFLSSHARAGEILGLAAEHVTVGC